MSRDDHDDYMSGAHMSGGEELPAPARVKWYNMTKGFGFVAPDGGGGDAFLHASVLTQAGLTDLPEGAQIICVMGPGPKGPQVVRIVSVVGGAPSPAPRRERGPTPEPTGPEVELEGTVKWFKSDKGFGFVLADDNGKDVFIHMNTLRRCDLGPLDSGQRVVMKVVPSQKGREATWVDLL